MSVLLERNGLLRLRNAALCIVNTELWDASSFSFSPNTVQLSHLAPGEYTGGEPRVRREQRFSRRIRESAPRRCPPCIHGGLNELAN